MKRAIADPVIPLQATKLPNTAQRDVVPDDDERASKPPPKVVYGYIRVVAGDEVRSTILKADLLVFSRSNGFMLSTVFAHFEVDDTAVVRPGFAALLDVCRLVGSYGVVVPSRLHLSADEPTPEVLTQKLKRTGAKLVALDDITAAGPGAGSSSDAHA